MTLAEIYQLEGNLEDGFVAILKNEAGINNVLHSRESVDTVNVDDGNQPEKLTPRVEVKVIVEGLEESMHILPDGIRRLQEGYNGTLETLLVTNRSDKAMTHRKLLGIVRAALQQIYVVASWLKYQTAILVATIWEDGTSDSFVDEDNLDNSRMRWKIRFNINPEIWPANI